MSTSSRINVLDEHTANRIAAGEVVERPASVVKELVENAIDAGATQISVILEQGGRELIKVVDNGCGMTRDDAVLSLQRHATSKIATADDLAAIRTLGFRGEALPSIASVSMFEMVTKHESEPDGVRLEAEAGTITNFEAVGAPQGTSIAVRNLFFNTPARLKFLKSSQTELSHVAEQIGWFAMAYPSVHFRLIHNNREVLSSPATGSLINSIAHVLGKDAARQMAEVALDTPILQVHGYVSNPSLTRVNRRDQVFFVNGRPVRNKAVTHALDQAYRGLLQPGRYPVAVIRLDIVPELVDVNVHPAKSEVKFSNEQEVHQAVYKAVNSALMAGAAVQSVPLSDTAPPHVSRPHASDKRELGVFSPSSLDLAAFQHALERRRSQATETEDSGGFVWAEGTGVPMEESPVPEAGFEEVRTVALRGVRVVGQARSMYIVAECDDGVLLIDQHVAHERVIFDRMIKAESSQAPAVQGLVIPLSISFSVREAAILDKRLDDIRKSGFDMEQFGSNTFVVRGIPAQLKPEDAETVLRGMVQELVELSVSGHLLVRAEQVLVTASCKMAVKAGEQLTQEEMERLVADLLKCENPFVCPHGRPIILSLPNWELDRKFRRM